MWKRLLVVGQNSEYGAERGTVGHIWGEFDRCIVCLRAF